MVSMALRQGEALVLSVAPFGERDALVCLLCAERGLVRGLVKGARGSSASKNGVAALLQPFNTVSYEHYRRLDGQLGTLSLDLVVSRAGLWLSGAGVMPLVVAYLSEVLVLALPEEHGYDGLYERVLRLLDGGLLEGWRALVAFELFLLETVGYALRLRPDEAVPCAENSALAYVSPASGRAVPLAVARGYESRLLVLPACMGGPVCGETEDFLRAWELTGFFLRKALHGKPLQARGRVADCYVRGMERDGVAQAA